MSNIPFLHSMNARKLAIHNSGRSFFNSGSDKHFLGVFLSIRTQGDLCKQIARAFFWSLQLQNVSILLKKPFFHLDYSDHRFQLESSISDRFEAITIYWICEYRDLYIPCTHIESVSLK